MEVSHVQSRCVPPVPQGHLLRLRHACRPGHGLGPGREALHLPLTRTAIELGSERVANIVALGALAALTDLCDLDALAHKVRVEAPRSLVHLNLDALGAGIGMAGQPLTAG